MPAPFDEGDFGDVDVAAGVDGHAVGPQELVGALSEVGIAEAVEHISFPVEDADAVADVCDAALDWCRALLSDEDRGVGAFADDVDGAGFVDRPLADEFAFGGEDLDAIAFTVADDYEVVVEDRNVVGEVELAVVGAGFAPGEDVVAFGVHAVDAGVAVSVGDEDVASCRVDSGIGGPVEHLAALARNFFAGSDGQEEFAGGGVFPYLVADVVDQPEVVFVVAGDAVGAHEPGLPKLQAVAVGILGGSDRTFGVVIAPHVDEVAVGIEDEDGYVAAVEDVDTVV